MKFSFRNKQSANEKAIGGAVQKTGLGIVALVVLYSDIMFVALLWDAFPGGFMRILAVGGAFATGISIIALLIGKSHWFRPGNQLVFSWWFTGGEVVVSILNVITAVMVAEGSHDLGILSYWLLIAPATPFVAVIGWIILLYQDSSRKQRHEEMEMEDQQRSSERQYQMMVFEANMDIKHGYLEQTRQRLHAALNSPAAQQVVDQHAQNLTAQVLNEITGLPVIPQSQAQQSALPPAAAPSTPALPAPAAQLSDAERLQLLQLAQMLQQLQQPRTSVQEVTGKLEAMPPTQTSPLPMAPLNSQTDQQSQNGNRK